MTSQNGYALANAVGQWNSVGHDDLHDRATHIPVLPRRRKRID